MPHDIKLYPITPILLKQIILQKSYFWQTTPYHFTMPSLTSKTERLPNEYKHNEEKHSSKRMESHYKQHRICDPSAQNQLYAKYLLLEKQAKLNRRQFFNCCIISDYNFLEIKLFYKTRNVGEKVVFKSII